MQNFLTDSIVTALGWTLVHSLWQGLVMTLLAGLVIVFTKKAKPGLRYSMLSILLLVFMAITCITFIRQLQPGTTAAIPHFTATTEQGINIVPGMEKEESVNEFLFSFSALASWLDRNTSLIVTVWFIIFLFKCARLGVQLNYTLRVRHYKNFPVPAWESRFAELASLLRVNRFVQLRESAIVHTPVVIGFLKPIVLLPLGLINSLPPAQVEAVLLHELAHIRRKDYLVNILQCFGETIFFFNPAVLWISSLIREERESCCDDMAIGVTNNKSEFIQALLSFQECNTGHSFYAQAFPGKKNQLLYRVKRIIYNNNKNLNTMEKIFLTSGLILAGALMLSFSPALQSGQKEPGQQTIAQQVPSSSTDTLPRSAKRTETGQMTGAIMLDDNGKEYKIEMKNGEVDELYINGEKIPKEKIVDYKEITDRLIAETKEKMEKSRKDAEIAREQSLKEKEQAAKSSDQVKLAREEAEKARMNAKIEKEAREESYKKDREELIEQAERNRKSERENRMKYKENEELQEKHNKEYRKELEKQEEILQESRMKYQEQLQKLNELRKEYAMKYADKNKEEVLMKMNDGPAMDNRKKELILKQQTLRLEKQQQLMLDEKQALNLNQKQQQLKTLTLMQAQRNKENGERAKERAEVSKKLSLKNKAKADEFRTRLINDLREEKLVGADEESFSVELSNDVMKVNGKSVSPDIHQKFKNNYIKGPNDRIKFQTTKNSTSSNIYVE